MGAENFDFSEEDMKDYILDELREIKKDTKEIPVIKVQLENTVSELKAHIKKHNEKTKGILYPLLVRVIEVIAMGCILAFTLNKI